MTIVTASRAEIPCGTVVEFKKSSKPYSNDDGRLISTLSNYLEKFSQ